MIYYTPRLTALTKKKIKLKYIKKKQSRDSKTQE